jgi:gliding motility-associated-like protein
LNDTINHTIWITDKSDFLGPDTATCDSIPVQLGIANIPEANYLWNTGDETNKINTQGYGQYWLTVRQNGCTIADTLLFYQKPKPVAKITGNREVCLNSDIILDASDPSVVSYLWNTGETSSSIHVQSAGTYSIQVTGNSCVVSDSVLVKWGDCEAFVPNAFTPNNDGLNDKFGVASGFSNNGFRMQIFDRYGNTVFVTSDNTIKWDGTNKGKLMPIGGYSWYISYTNTKSIKVFLQGTVLLIR